MSDASILVVDDEPDIRGLLQEILEDEGYAVSVADTAAAAQALIDEAHPDLVLLDIWMPHGAVDFIEKPVSLAKLLLTVEKALSEGVSESAGGGRANPIRRLPLLLGVSDHVKYLREQLDEHAGRMDSVLLIGESGSGRVLFAQNVHDRNAEVNGRFIQLRCDTLSSANAHRELYGDENDGAVSMGYLESASGGTLFLTDVELLPPTAQQCLRQAIEQQGFMRTGGNVRVPFRCRIMSSSRAELASAVKQGSLDATLARLLSSSTLDVKPLREHPEDIPALLEAFVDWHVEEEGMAYRHFTVAAQNRLRNLDWPGNLLELKNLVQRILLLGGPAEIEVSEVNRALGVQVNSDTSLTLRHDLPLREARADFERQYLLKCLSDAHGNIGDLAKHVGMERTHLYRKLKSLSIEFGRNKE